MTNLWEMDASTTADAVRRGTCTAEQRVSAALGRIDREDPDVKAFVEVDREGALASARAVDASPAREHMPLCGVPVAVKEVFDVRGLLCAWGTRIHEERRPDADSAVVERLRAAGAVIVGTTTSTEYAIAHSAPTRNPHDHERTPGGSSSGSAAAVAAGMVPIAIGSQTIGSIVRPAVYCGVYGLKPSFGAISTYGGMVLSPPIDHPGLLATSPEDLLLGCRVLFGRDHRDSRSLDIAAPETGRVLNDLEVLLIDNPHRERIGPPTREALARAEQALRAAGFEARHHELPDSFEDALRCQQVMVAHDIARHHGEDYERHRNLMSEPLRELIERGRSISEEDYARACDQTASYREVLRDLLDSRTVILAPATDSYAPPFGPLSGPNVLQGLWTLVGLPTLAIPCGKLDGLPIGVQLIAAHTAESLLLAAGRRLADHLPPGTPQG